MVPLGNPKPLGLKAFTQFSIHQEPKNQEVEGENNHRNVDDVKSDITQGSLKYHFFWDQSWCKSMVILRDSPYYNALFGLVI